MAGPIIVGAGGGGGGGGGPVTGLDFSQAADASVAVRDVVYVRADGVVDQADASAVTTARAAGICSAVSGGPTATVVTTGTVAGFSGLTPGANYILGTAPGTLVREDDTGNVNYPGSVGEFRKIIGFALTATVLNVDLGPLLGL